MESEVQARPRTGLRHRFCGYLIQISFGALAMETVSDAGNRPAPLAREKRKRKSGLFPIAVPDPLKLPVVAAP